MSTNNRIGILGIPFDNNSEAEAVDKIFDLIGDYKLDRKPKNVVTVNVDFMVNAHSWQLKQARHPELLEVLRCADLVVPDGMPLVWLSRLLGSKLKERVTGADIVPRLAEQAAKNKASVYLLGGNGDVAIQAARVLKQKNPELSIAGCDSPMVYIEGEALADTEKTDREIVRKINNSNPDILLIAFGNPKQELWFHRNRHRLRVPVSVGVGGSFEFITGRVKRAPVWMSRSGLEWLYRISQDARRLWKRYLIGLFKFGYMALPVIIYQNWMTSINKLRGFENGELKKVNVDQNTNINEFDMPVKVAKQTISSIRKELFEKQDDNSRNVLNFRNVKYIDAHGLAFLLEIWIDIENKYSNIYTINIPRRIMRFLRISRCYELSDQSNQLSSGVLDEKELPSCRIDKDGNKAIVNLSGKVDVIYVSQLDFENLIHKINQSNVIVNLSNATFIDSFALGLFLKMIKYSTDFKLKLSLSGLNDKIYHTLRILKVKNLFEYV